MRALAAAIDDMRIDTVGDGSCEASADPDEAGTAVELRLREDEGSGS